MFKRQQFVHFSLLASLALCAPAHADSTFASNDKYVTFSGFGTLGAVHNRGEGAELTRDLTQPKGSANRGITWTTDTRVGIQANYKPIENLEGVVQVVSHYRWDNNFKPELTWGFLKYTLNDSLSLRAGRIGFDAFLAADSRDVGFSYLWARPPVEYYGVLTIPYFDGLDAIFQMPVGSGVARLKLYSGIDRQMIPTQFGLTQDLSGSRTSGGFLDYQDNHWTVRVGMADTKLSKEFPDGGLNFPHILSTFADMQTDPAVKEALSSIKQGIVLTGKHTVFTSIGLAYEDGPLQAQMAVSHMDSKTMLLPNSNGGYLSVGYRYGAFTPYVAISAVKSKKNHHADDLMGKGIGLYPVLSISNYMFSSSEMNQNTTTLGMRYNLNSDAALKFQIDMIRNSSCSPISQPVIGTSPACSSPLLWPSVPTSWDGRATAYSAILDFIF